MGQDAARLGQLFMLGFRGTTLSADHWLVGAVRDQGLGGVILFDRNVDGTVQNVVSPDQLRRLVDDLQQLAPLPLLVGIDQEGGGSAGSATALPLSAPRAWAASPRPGRRARRSPGRHAGPAA